MNYWLSISSTKSTHLIEIHGAKENVRNALQCLSLPGIRAELLVTKSGKNHKNVVCTISEKNLFKPAKPFAKVEKITFAKTNFVSAPSPDPLGNLAQWLTSQTKEKKV